MMKHFLAVISLLFFYMNLFSADFSIKTGKEKGFSYNTNNTVFIFGENTDGVTIAFTADTTTDFKWFRYTENYIDDPSDTVRLTVDVDYKIADDSLSSTLLKPESGYGYFVEYQDKNSIAQREYLWLTPYKPITAVTWNKEEIYCEDFTLDIQPPMFYLLSDRRKRNIERDLSLTYSTFDDNNHNPGIIEHKENNVLADTLLKLDSVPYANTDFTIVDHFAEKLNLSPAVSKIVTDTFYTSAVIAFPHMLVNNKQENELDPNNNWETDSLNNVIYYFISNMPDESSSRDFRTSAPLSVDFKSNASPAVNRYEWHFSRDPNFANSYVYFDKDINSYIFKDPGYYYIKLIVSSYDGTGDICTYNTFACVNVSDSEIYVPNAFTPNGDGSNDEFKVAYRSINSFYIKIYNGWGRLVYDSTDITKGWDGTIGGTKASIGTYFYVIEAKGTDGRKINKKGTVNLVRSR